MKILLTGAAGQVGREVLSQATPSICPSSTFSNSVARVENPGIKQISTPDFQSGLHPMQEVNSQSLLPLREKVPEGRANSQSLPPLREKVPEGRANSQSLLPLQEKGPEGRADSQFLLPLREKVPEGRADSQFLLPLREKVPEGRMRGISIYPFTHSELDITNQNQLEKTIQDLHPQVIINTAAYTAVDKAEQDRDQAFAVNSEGVRNLALICKQYDLPLIHVSTDYVFDGQKTSPYEEDDRRAPINVYGASKAAGEIALQETWQKHVIVRASWIFGQYGNNFVKTILKLARTQEELRIVEDQRGCPTAASDLANCLLQLAEKCVNQSPHWGIFHYSGDQAVSWYEFAKLIVQYGKEKWPLQCQKILPIPSVAFPTPAERPKNSVMNIRKIQATYGILASDWKKALKEMVQTL